MATTYQYRLTRYSSDRAERQLSQIGHLQADTFRAASSVLEHQMRGAADADPSWSYEIASLEGLGYHGKTALGTDLTFWPTDAKKDKNQ
jgi:hypothetical protein